MEEYGVAIRAFSASKAGAWLLQEDAVRRAQAALRVELGVGPGGQFAFALLVGYRLLDFMRRKENHRLASEPSARDRRRARENATKLREHIENVPPDSPQLYAALQRTLSLYESEQAERSNTRKRREDKTSEQRLLVTSVVWGIMDLWSAAPPSAVKPLGSLVGYEVDDTTWRGLIRSAKDTWCAEPAESTPPE
jgi:hypothetical protein